MQLSDFDFDLKEERIALYPASERDGAKLLYVLEDGALQDRMIRDLTALFEAGDLLVLNDSRVLPASLSGLRVRGELRAKIHLNLHKRLSNNQWASFAKPAKKLRVGDRLLFGTALDGAQGTCLAGGLEGTVSEVPGGGEVVIDFDFSGAALMEALHGVGQMPLPPYIAGKRAVTSDDDVSYQTVFGRIDGSVAAPTAGLHFTERLMEALKSRGVNITYVTLHIGAGTFLPVKVEDIDAHKMHAEWGEVSSECVEAVKVCQAKGGRVCAVGTTSLRLLETAAEQISGFDSWVGDTDIFIRPGFDFKVVDRLLTNFHLPKSTLFMLVSAFSGLDVMQGAYRHAIENEYRFYSYGDACLLEGMKRG